MDHKKQARFIKYLIGAALLAVVALVRPPAAQAILIRDTYPANLGVAYPVSREYDEHHLEWSGRRDACPFSYCDGDYVVTNVILKINRVSGDSSNLLAGVYSESGGHPGTLLFRLDNPATISDTLDDNIFTYSGPVRLSADTAYWLVLEPSMSVESSFAWAVSGASSDDMNTCFLDATGDSWGSWSGESATMAVQIYGALVQHEICPSNGPSAGGNFIAITNCIPAIGSGGDGDITNITVGGVGTTNIMAQSATWVLFVAPAVCPAGVKDVVVQSAAVGDTTLSGAYTVNPMGTIGTEWGEMAGLPTNRYGLAAGVLSGEVYAVGGYTWVSNVYRYCGANWEEVAGLPEGRRNMGVGVCSGLLYVVGGAVSPSADATTNVYTFDNMSWTEINGLPDPDGRTRMGVGVVSGQVYSVGGHSQIGGSKTNVYRLDGASWTEVVGLPAARYSMGCGFLNNRLYVVGGLTNATAGHGDGTTNVFMFDGETWTEVPGLPEKRGELTACVWQERLYAIGGKDAYGVTPTNSVYRFDGSIWESVAGLPVGRAILASAAVGNQILAIGGTDGSGGQTNVYFYPSGGVSPTFGSITGGYTVTISGENLGNGADITNVTLCGVNAAIQSGQSATQVVVIADVGGPGQGDVRVFSTSYGETVKSNGFTYTVPVMIVLGTNGAAIASGENASAEKGTDFGSISWGTAWTNTFSIVNNGNETLNITGVTTGGIQNAEFSVQNMPARVDMDSVSNFTIYFAPSVAGTYTAAVEIANNSTTTPYIIYLAGTLNPAPIPNGWLAIEVTPASGSWQVTAPAGYTGPTSGTGNLAAVSAVTGQYGVSYGALSGYIAPSNVTGFVTAGNTTLFAGVYLQISTNIDTPSGVNATEGTYTNKIRVVWNGVEGATGYEIWRSRTNDPTMAGLIADIPENSSLLIRLSDDLKGRAQPPAEPQNKGRFGRDAEPCLRDTHGSVYAYDDYAINPINAYYYWVRAKTFSLISPMSYVGMGYAAIDPHGASGTADIAVRDLVFLPVNMTNNSHAGTVSFRLANLGPDVLTAAGVAFDFQMGTSAAAFVWIGSAQSNMTLAVGGEKLIILPPSAKSGLAVRGDLSGVQQVQVGIRHLSALNDPNLANNTTLAAGSVMVKTNGPNSIGRGLSDYDGDGKADLAVFKVGQGVWSVVFSGMRYTRIAGMNTGLGNWQGAPGDYDGDGLNDIGIFNPASGYWWVWLSSTRQAAGAQCGAMGFVAAPCDFDGDGKTDLLAYREADGYWLGLGSASDYAIYFGAWWCGATPQPVPADYDGDRLADLMDYAESSGMWFGGLSTGGYQPMSGGYGGPGFVAVPADYDGDGREDLGVYEYATGWWHVLMSNRSTGLIGHGYREASGRMGAPDGLPVVADYDGDGLADPAVYHSANGLWQIYLSASGYSCLSGGYGGPGYVPVSE